MCGGGNEERHVSSWLTNAPKSCSSVLSAALGESQENTETLQPVAYKSTPVIPREIRHDVHHSAGFHSQHWEWVGGILTHCVHY